MKDTVYLSVALEPGMQHWWWLAFEPEGTEAFPIIPYIHHRFDSFDEIPGIILEQLR